MTPSVVNNLTAYRFGLTAASQACYFCRRTVFGPAAAEVRAALLTVVR